MTPILARFVTAALIGAASFANLHPCVAAAIHPPERARLSDSSHPLRVIPGPRSGTRDP
jgi:hypothetical protein